MSLEPLGVHLGDIGAGAALILVVLLILFGRLVPVRTLERELAAAHQRADDYRAAYEASDARNDALVGQVGELLELARATTAVVEAIPVAAHRQQLDEGAA